MAVKKENQMLHATQSLRSAAAEKESLGVRCYFHPVKNVGVGRGEGGGR